MTTNTVIRKNDGPGYQAFHGDGLLDIFVGIGVMIITASMMSEVPWMAAIFPATFVPIWRDARKKLTNPRLVRYDIRTGRDHRAMMLIVVTTLVGVLGLILGLIVFLLVTNNLIPEWLGSSQELMPAVIIGGLSLGLMILTGFTLGGARRYLAYAGLEAGLLVLTVIFDVSLVIPLFGTALLMVFGGLIVMFKFMREYPV